MSKESDEIIRSVLNNAVAESIKKNVTKFNRYRKPMESAAYRIANEYVIQYLFSHGMDITADVGESESKSYLHEHHNQAWIARRLKYDEDVDLFQQLKGGINTYSDTYDSSSESDNYDYKKRKLRSRGNQMLQSSDDDIFTNMVSSDDEDLYRAKKHHKHENQFFTILEEDEEAKKYAKKPSSRLYARDNVSQPSKRRMNFANKEKEPFETIIDTRY